MVLLSADGTGTINGIDRDRQDPRRVLAGAFYGGRRRRPSACIPPGRLVHVVLDNYAAHKDEQVRAWFDRHPRWTFHFTPTPSFGLNTVEGFFAILMRRGFKCSVFWSLAERHHRRSKKRVPNVEVNELNSCWTGMKNYFLR